MLIHSERGGGGLHAGAPDPTGPAGALGHKGELH